MYREDSVMGRLRLMNVGDVVYYPLEDWGRCRTAAYYLKRDFGATFRVRKYGDRIAVTRVEAVLSASKPLTPKNLITLGFVKSTTHHGLYTYHNENDYFGYYTYTGKMVYRCNYGPKQSGSVCIHYVYELQNLADLLHTGITFKL